MLYSARHQSVIVALARFSKRGTRQQGHGDGQFLTPLADRTSMGVVSLLASRSALLSLGLGVAGV